jgi:hypothetical protein
MMLDVLHWCAVVGLVLQLAWHVLLVVVLHNAYSKHNPEPSPEHVPALWLQLKCALLCHAVEQARPEHACWVVLLAKGQQLVELGVQRGHGALGVAESAVKILALRMQQMADSTAGEVERGNRFSLRAASYTW